MKNLKYFILITLAFGFSSCTEIIELDLNEGEQVRLVVEGWITTQTKQHEVELTWTTDYFANEAAPRAIDAVVSISDGDNTWVLAEEEPGTYRTSVIAGEPGKTYTLDIIIDDQEYTASSLMREEAEIDDIVFKYVDPYEEFGFDFLDPYYEVQLWTQEVEGLGDAYMWPLWVNGDPLLDSLKNLTFQDDTFIDGIYFPGAPVAQLIIDEEVFVGDTVYVEQWNIGMEAWDVFWAVFNETEFNGGLFDAPPANVPTNVSNGAIGYFGAAAVTEIEAIVEE